MRERVPSASIVGTDLFQVYELNLLLETPTKTPFSRREGDDISNFIF